MSPRRAKRIRRAAAAHVVAECRARGVEPTRGMLRRYARQLRRLWDRTPWPLRARAMRTLEAQP